jgi:polysaccharide biosynthesis protein PslJ
MSRSSSRGGGRRRDALILAVVAGLTTSAISTSLVTGHVIWLAGVAAAAAGGALFLVDITLLPAIALAACVLLPTSYLRVNTYHGALSPALGVMIVLLIRATAEGVRFRRGPHLLPLVLLSLWIISRALGSPIRTTSMTWSLSFIVLVTVPALVLPGWPIAQRRVEQWWLALGALLGIYGLVELALHANPIFGSFYASALGATPAGNVYRITTTLGDPLLNGVFFSLASLIGIGRILHRPARWEVAATALSIAGLFATSSRGAALALGVGLVIVLAVTLGSPKVTRTRQTIVTATLLIIAIGAGGGAYLSQRASSSEAAASTSVRLETYQAGETLVRQYWPLGAGPGLTDVLKYAMPIGNYQRGVESSAFEVLIDLGLPGALLTLWLFGAAALSALRSRPELSACVIAYVVVASTFNLLDEYRPALLLWGLLVGVAVRSGPRPSSPSEDRYVNR